MEDEDDKEGSSEKDEEAVIKCLMGRRRYDDIPAAYVSQLRYDHSSVRSC